LTALDADSPLFKCLYDVGSLRFIDESEGENDAAEEEGGRHFTRQKAKTRDNLLRVPSPDFGRSASRRMKAG